MLGTTDGDNNSFCSKQKSEFIIKEICKDNQRIIKDTSIDALEELYMPDATEERTFYVEGYVSMIENKEYVLFLTYSEDEKAFIPLEYGKIPLDKEEYIYFKNEKNQTKHKKYKEKLQKRCGINISAICFDIYRGSSNEAESSNKNMGDILYKWHR